MFGRTNIRPDKNGLNMCLAVRKPRMTNNIPLDWLKYRPTKEKHSLYPKQQTLLLYTYQSGTANPYNQVNTDTGSYWPDQYRYRRSDRVHWNTRLYLLNKCASIVSGYRSNFTIKLFTAFKASKARAFLFMSWDVSWVCFKDLHILYVAHLVTLHYSNLTP